MHTECKKEENWLASLEDTLQHWSNHVGSVETWWGQWGQLKQTVKHVECWLKSYTWNGLQVELTAMEVKADTSGVLRGIEDGRNVLKNLHTVSAHVQEVPEWLQEQNSPKSAPDHPSDLSSVMAASHSINSVQGHPEDDRNKHIDEMIMSSRKLGPEEQIGNPIGVGDVEHYLKCGNKKNGVRYDGDRCWMDGTMIGACPDLKWAETSMRAEGEVDQHGWHNHKTVHVPRPPSTLHHRSRPPIKYFGPLLQQWQLKPQPRKVSHTHIYRQTYQSNQPHQDQIRHIGCIKHWPERLGNVPDTPSNLHKWCTDWGQQCVHARAYVQ